MDPTTVIASINLASKILPEAVGVLNKLGDTDKSGQNLPKNSVAFETILESQKAAPASARTLGDTIGLQLLHIPEVQGRVDSADWSRMNFEIKSDGQLTIIQENGTRSIVPLSPDSQAQLQSLYAQTKQISPPLVAGGQNLKLEIGPEQFENLPVAGRSVTWTTESQA